MEGLGVPVASNGTGESEEHVLLAEIVAEILARLREGAGAMPDASPRLARTGALARTSAPPGARTDPRTSSPTSSLKKGKNKREWVSPDEVAAVRARLCHNFPEPTDDERAALAEFTARLTGRTIGPNHAAWIRDVLVVHGPGAGAALEQGYRESGWDNLLLRVVDSPPISAADRAAESAPEPVAAEEWQWTARAEGVGGDVAPEPSDGALAMFTGDPSDSDLPVAPPLSPPSDDLWTCYPGLLYGPNDAQPFDPTSTTRWDDRPSNPDRDALRARHEAVMRRAER